MGNSQANRYSINTDTFEKTVLRELFEVLSVKETLRAAVFSGNPIGKVADKLQAELTQKQDELGRVESQLNSFVTAIGNADDVTAFKPRIKPRIVELESRAKVLEDEVGLLEYRLSSLASDDEIEASRGKWAGTLEAVKESYLISGLALASLPFENCKKIIRMVFGGTDETGKRYGIYITCLGGSPRKYKFYCYGRLRSMIGFVNARTGEGACSADGKLLDADGKGLSDSITKVIECDSLCCNTSRRTPPRA